MTAADIPLTLGQPDQGYEGNRFTGIPLYDALVEWGSVARWKSPAVWCRGWRPSGTSIRRIPAAGFSPPRPGVKFHDGTEVNADAIVWNVDKVLE